VLNGSDFTVLIRSIIGLDAQAAKALFAEFINRPNITAEQMVFINALIDFLTKNGRINRGMLFDRPFTDINQNGVSGVFEDDDARLIIKIIDGFNQQVNIA
jgi:type I restriction enzyme R subunit